MADKTLTFALMDPPFETARSTPEQVVHYDAAGDRASAAKSSMIGAMPSHMA